MYGEEQRYELLSNKDPEYRSRIWDIAAAMQQADGLHLSNFASKLGVDYKNSDLSAAEVVQSIEHHYNTKAGRQKEADIVTARIVRLLENAGDQYFEPSMRMLKDVHSILFTGVLGNEEWETEWRTEPISKDEPVLGGQSVTYFFPENIENGLKNDFKEEATHSYNGILTREDVRHFSDFIAGIWQIHPFREGNTRTCAVFSQLYLAELGIAPDNSYYKSYGLWYRDALVRASFYSRGRDGKPPVYRNPDFLYAFYENVVLDAGNDLLSMDMNVHGIRKALATDLPYRTPRDYEAGIGSISSPATIIADRAIEPPRQSR